MREDSRLTRRGILFLAGGAGLQAWNRLYASDSQFWNKKDPSEWSVDERDKLKTKSPWAKEITASAPQSGTGLGRMGGGGMGGGMGIPGMGGGIGRRGGGRGRRTPAATPYKGVVRWMSAAPMLLVIKTTLPETLANHYVISVSGIPITGSGRRQSNADDDNARSSVAGNDTLDRIKDLTYLEPKGKPPAQPGLIQMAPDRFPDPNTLFFGFSRDLLQLTAEDKEVTFTAQIGSIEVKAKFNPKEMRYHEELAL